MSIDLAIALSFASLNLRCGAVPNPCVGTQLRYGPNGEMEWIMYLGWYDPDKKRPLDKKLADAIQRYEQKWDEAPTVALVNPADFEGLTAREDIEVRPAGNVAPNVFFVGCDFENSVVS